MPCGWGSKDNLQMSDLFLNTWDQGIQLTFKLGSKHSFPLSQHCFILFLFFNAYFDRNVDVNAT